MALDPNSSVPAMVFSRVAAHGADIVLRKKHRGIWQAVTWQTFGEQIRGIALALHAVGIKPGDVVGVLAETRPEWAEIDLGILTAGGVSLGIPPDNEPEQLTALLQGSGARVLFVENEEQLDKVLLVRGECTTLQRVIILDRKGLREFDDPMCSPLASFVAQDAGGDAAWQTMLTAVAPEQPAILTTHQDGAGLRPLTHREVLHSVNTGAAKLECRAGDERLVVMPMWQASERIYGTYLALHTRVVSNYLESPDTIIGNLQEVQPTVFGADTAIWERLYARIDGAATAATRLQRALYRWAIEAAQPGGAAVALARWLVLRAVQRELGFTRLRRAYVTNGLPPPQVVRWAAALNAQIRQLDPAAQTNVASDSRHRAVPEKAYSS